ncbi:MAG: hypothetical protein WAQ25_04965 [Candidatus Saccharimonas sp.]
MKSDLNLKQLVQALSHFLHRYHMVLFATVVIGGLSLATFLINQSINAATTTVTPPPTETFDSATIKRIKELSPSAGETKPLELPAGRTNPFVGA